MGKNDRLSRDQKRKAKLKKRAERSRNHEPLAYSGKKYKTDEFVPVIYRTELGVYQSYVMCERELTDDEVEGAIERLVIEMREGPLPPFPDADVINITEDGEEDLVIMNIRLNWRIMEEKGTLPSRDDLIGVLRTILNSISTWRSQSLHSQGYLHYIEGFMKKLGVTVQPATPDLQPLPEPEEDPLLLIGRAWITKGDILARAEFANQIESLLRSGGAERVIDVCQQLMGETKELSGIPFFQDFALRAHWALKTEMG